MFTFSEHESDVKTLEAALLTRTTEQLTAQGLTVVPQKAAKWKEWRGDAWLRVGKDNRHVDYVVEAKRNVTPATLGAVVAQLRDVGEENKRTPILFTGYITPPGSASTASCRPAICGCRRQ